MRNTHLKEIREEWKGRARFFFGRNRVMAKALGTTVESAYAPQLHLLQPMLTGSTGLLFTNEPIETVLEYFQGFERDDYARGGGRATETVILPAGPVMRGVDSFPNSMESQIRGLGVPTLLKNGVIY